MRTLKTATFAAAGISMLLLSACGTGEGNGTVSPSESPNAADTSGATSEETSTANPGDPSGELTPETLEGKWGADQKGDPFLEFKTDETVIGTDGCNGINSTYTIEASTIHIEPWVTTAKGCTDIDTWLSGASTAEITDSNENADEMTVKDKDGEEIGTLIREK